MEAKPDKTLNSNAGNVHDGAQKDPLVDQGLAEIRQVSKPEYSREESAYRDELIRRMVLMRDQRDRPHPELDGMTYVQYYESNRRKDLSYLIPKMNRQDVRVVTGTTREKDTTLLTSVLGLNFEAEVTAFDPDNMLVGELGENMGNLVDESLEVEDWKKKRSIIYRELISQGDVFVQDLHVERFRDVETSSIDWDPNKHSLKDFKYKSRLQKIFNGFERRMINGKKVYLGNVREPFIENQPMVAVLNVLPRDIAEEKYRNWERWINVPYTVDTINTWFNDGTTYKDWNLITLNDRDRVAEIMVFFPQKNRFNIMLNGVMMLPYNYPLTAIEPTGEIPIAQGKNEPISDFAYSKSQPSKTKVDQETIDEVTKLAIESFRQLVKPPKGSAGKKVYGNDIYTAGKITYDMQPNALFDVMASAGAGISAPAMGFYQMIKQSIDEKTTSPNFAGQQPDPVAPGQPAPGGGQPQTATGAIQQQNNQMEKLGLTMDGVTNLERRLTWLRINNLLANGIEETYPGLIDEKRGIYDGFKSMTVKANVDSGQKGTKIFRFKKGNYPHPYDHEHEENKLSEQHGHPVRIVYLNPDMLRDTKYKWFIQIKPNPKNNDKLSQAMFLSNLTQAIQIFGPQAVNMDYAKERYAALTNENYSKFFVKASIQNLLQQQNAQQQQNQNSGPNGQGGNGNGGGNNPPVKIGNGNAPIMAARR